MVIVLYKANRQYHWQLIAGTGKIVLASQYYLRKWKARRAARKLAKQNKYPLREVDDRG